MAVNGPHDTGEEWMQKHIWRQDLITRDASVDVGVFDEATDTVTETDDVGDITSEPSGGSYARVAQALDGAGVTIEQSGGDVQIVFTVTLDLTDASNTPDVVDSYFVVANFQSDVVNAEGAQNDHIIASAEFAEGDQTVSSTGQLDVTVTIPLS